MNKLNKKKWLVTGASGLLGTSLCHHLISSNQTVTAIANQHSISIPNVAKLKIDLSKPSQSEKIYSKLSQHIPDIFIHAAGLTNVDACEKNESVAYRLHVAFPAELAALCRINNKTFVYISTDHLWDGHQEYASEDRPLAPINAYARTKAEGEKKVLQANPSALVIRTNFFGTGNSWRQSFSDRIIEKLRVGENVNAFIDSYFTPINLEHLAPIILETINKNGMGIFHIASNERISKYNFALRICKKMGLASETIIATKIEDMNLEAPRPSDMSLSTKKISHFLNRSMPTIDDGIDALFKGQTN